MTVTFGMVEMIQRAADPSVSGIQTSDDAGRDFATLLSARALLDAAPGSAAGGSDSSEGQFAPIARRFDEAPLFGQAYLATRRSSNSMPRDSFSSFRASASDANEGHGRLSLRAGDGPPDPSNAKSAVTVLLALDHERQLGSGRLAGTSLHPVPPESARSRVSEGVVLDMSSGGARPYAFSGERRQNAVRTDVPGISVAFGSEISGVPDNSQSSMLSPAKSRMDATGTTISTRFRSDAGEGLADKARQSRSQAIHQLGPVCLVLRGEGAILHLTARVATSVAEGEEELDQRLRKVVADEFIQLGAFRINGRERSALARR